MDPSFLKLWFSEGDPPDWPCPDCSRGRLEVDFRKLEVAMYHAGYDGEGVFTCIAKCNSQLCGEPVALLGRAAVEYDPHKGCDITEYRPMFFNPHIRPFPIPGAASGIVRNEILAAFRVFWANPSMAVARIRTALEKVLDEAGIPKKEGGKGRLSLHERIKRYEETRPEEAQLAMGLKNLGNTGTHEQVGESDATDALEVLEYLLEKQYGPQKETPAEKAARWIDNKGKV